MMSDIIIRNANINDIPQLLKIYSYYVENTAISFEYETPSIKEFEERLRNIQKKYPYIVALKNEKIVGYAYANTLIPRKAYDYSVETTIYVYKDYKKQGIGKVLYKNLEEILKQQGIKNLYACIAYTDNENEFLTNDSIKFHSSMGYTKNGHFHKCGYKFERWYDMVWMEKIL